MQFKVKFLLMALCDSWQLSLSGFFPRILHRSWPLLLLVFSLSAPDFFSPAWFHKGATFCAAIQFWIELLAECKSLDLGVRGSINTPRYQHGGVSLVSQRSHILWCNSILGSFFGRVQVSWPGGQGFNKHSKVSTWGGFTKESHFVMQFNSGQLFW